MQEIAVSERAWWWDGGSCDAAANVGYLIWPRFCLTLPLNYYIGPEASPQWYKVSHEEIPAEIPANTMGFQWHCRRPSIQVIRLLNHLMYRLWRKSCWWRSYTYTCGTSQKTGRTWLILTDSPQFSVVFIALWSLAVLPFCYSWYFSWMPVDFHWGIPSMAEESATPDGPSKFHPQGTHCTWRPNCWNAPCDPLANTEEFGCKATLCLRHSATGHWIWCLFPQDIMWQSVAL